MHVRTAGRAENVVNRRQRPEWNLDHKTADGQKSARFGRFDKSFYWFIAPNTLFTTQVELKTGSVYLAWRYKSSARLDWPRKKEPLFKQESNAAEWIGLD